jgi:hypothetical protein
MGLPEIYQRLPGADKKKFSIGSIGRFMRLRRRQAWRDLQQGLVTAEDSHEGFNWAPPALTAGRRLALMRIVPVRYTERRFALVSSEVRPVEFRPVEDRAGEALKSASLRSGTRAEFLPAITSNRSFRA